MKKNRPTPNRRDAQRPKVHDKNRESFIDIYIGASKAHKVNAAAKKREKERTPEAVQLKLMEKAEEKRERRRARNRKANHV